MKKILDDTKEKKILKTAWTISYKPTLGLFNVWNRERGETVQENKIENFYALRRAKIIKENIANKDFESTRFEDIFKDNIEIFEVNNEDKSRRYKSLGVFSWSNSDKCLKNNKGDLFDHLKQETQLIGIWQGESAILKVKGLAAFNLFDPKQEKVNIISNNDSVNFVPGEKQTVRLKSGASIKLQYLEVTAGKEGSTLIDRKLEDLYNIYIDERNELNPLSISSSSIFEDSE